MLLGYYTNPDSYRDELHELNASFELSANFLISNFIFLIPLCSPSSFILFAFL